MAKLLYVSFLITIASCKTGQLSLKKEADTTKIESELDQVKLDTFKISRNSVSDIGAVSVNAQGILENKVVLSLDYFPSPKMNKASLPQCLNAISIYESVGYIQCSSGKRIALQGRHIIQDCSIDAKKSSLMKSPLSGLNECHQGQIMIFELEPKTDISLR